jgi:hypothetical protein
MDTETSLASIRAVLAPDATGDARTAGAAVCRALLAALGSSPERAPAKASLDAAMVTNALAALRGVPPDRLLDLAIEKLRAALPAGTDLQPVAPLKLQLLTPPSVT